MVKAIIFDVDGLLVDSEPLWDEARRAMARRLGKDWNRDDHRAIMGVSTAEWTDYMIRRWQLTLSPQQVQTEVMDQLQALYQRQIPFLPGAIAAVALAADTCPTAVASGSHRRLLDAVVAHPSLAGRFKVVVSGDEVASGKPAPDIYLKTARQLGVSPSDCLCLEDSANGIRAGKAAGLFVIAVPDTRFPQDPAALAQADLVLPALCEFTPELLQGLREEPHGTL